MDQQGEGTVVTLRGVGLPLYAAMGFQEVEAIPIDLPDGVIVEAVKMIKPSPSA